MRPIILIIPSHHSLNHGGEPEARFDIDGASVGSRFGHLQAETRENAVDKSEGERKDEKEDGVLD